MNEEEEFAAFGEEESPFADIEDNTTKPNDEEDVVYDDIEEADVTEHMMLEYLTSNQHLWTKANTIMDAEYFQHEYRSIIPFVTTFIKDHGKLPPKNIIYAETGVKLNTPDDHNDDEILEYVAKKFEDHCKIQSMSQMIIDASDRVGQENMTSLAAEMVTRSQDITKMSLVRDLGDEVLISAKRILSNSEEFDGQSTVFGFFDMVFDGGVTRPSFNLLSGSSGDGKSIMMQNVISYASENGLNAVFYSLELEPAIVMKRFASMITNTDIAKVYQKVDAVNHDMKRRSKTQGRIWLKKFPMTKTTMADIEAHYNDLVSHTETEWPVVCIDYIDVLTPIEKVDLSNIHIRDDFISKEMNQFFHSHNIMGWTAAQQTKGAREEKDSRAGAVAGGKDKVSIADNVIVLKRTTEDLEEQRVWWNVEKSRSSGALKTRLPMKWDSQTQKVSDGDYDLLLEANPSLKYKLNTSKPQNTKEPEVNKKRPTQAEADAKEIRGGNTQDKLVNRLKKRF